MSGSGAVTTSSTPYKPCGSTEIESFMCKYCYRCIKYPVSAEASYQCSILLTASIFEPGDKDFPRNWVKMEGKPRCTSFKNRVAANCERRAKAQAKNEYQEELALNETIKPGEQ